MSYFEDQYDAWMDNNCQGEITDMNPDEHWINKIESCNHKFKNGACKKCGVIE